MLILGIIMTLAGAGAAIYGNHLNNDVEAVLSSFFSGGSGQPGDIWLYGGIAVAVIGIILVIVGAVNKNKGDNA